MKNIYNAECATRLIKSVEFTNISNDLQKFLLWKQFVAWHCSGPITDYVNNPLCQELPDEIDYFGAESGERIYIDLRDSLGYTNEIEKPSRNDSRMTLTVEVKNALRKKIRLRVWGYSNGESY